MSVRRNILRVVAGRGRYTVLEGDCLVHMRAIPDAVVDLVLCDLPYGMTDCEWDHPLPFDDLWEHYRRVLAPGGAIVLTASGSFAVRLAASNLKWYRGEWIWDKVNRVTGFANANRRPLKAHETVLVFYPRQPTYNPQMTTGGKPYRSRCGSKWAGMNSHIEPVERINTGERYPTTILRIPAPGRKERGLHPTQKPVALMEYFVRTYTDAGALVLDNCMGSGTTGVACVRAGRRFIGIELSDEYSALARRRIRAASPICPTLKGRDANLN